MRAFITGRRGRVVVGFAAGLLVTAGVSLATMRLAERSLHAMPVPLRSAPEQTMPELPSVEPTVLLLPATAQASALPLLLKSPVDPERPESFVAINVRGDVVVALSGNGHVTRTLVRASDLKRGEEISGLELSPDRATVYLVIRHSDSCHTIASVPFAGGAMRSVVRGTSPSVSLDGKRLAYAEVANCDSNRSRVVVRDLATRQERAWAEEPCDCDGGLGGEVHWSPDPRNLLVWSCGVDNCQAISLDTASKAGTVDAASRQIADESNGFWRCYAVRGNRGTVVARAAYNDVDSSDELSEIDLRTGKSRTLVEAAGNLGCFEFDATGDRALVVGPGDILYEWTRPGIWAIGSGFREAAW